MKLSELNKHLRHTSLDDYDVDISGYIVHDEFMAKGRDRNYRVRAIRRLISMGVPFCSEGNIIFDLAPLVLTVKCPYDGLEMQPKGGSGTGDGYILNWQCTCGTRIHLSLSSDSIGITPKRTDES